MELQLFIFKDNNIRTSLDAKNEVIFNANDICFCLELTNPRKAIKDLCFSEDVTTSYTLTKGGKQKMTYVNISGVFALIFGSKKQKAKEFKHWVTNEVLPSIFKTGKYEIPLHYSIKNNTQFLNSLPKYEIHNTLKYSLSDGYKQLGYKNRTLSKKEKIKYKSELIESEYGLLASASLMLKILGNAIAKYYRNIIDNGNKIISYSPGKIQKIIKVKSYQTNIEF